MTLWKSLASGAALLLMPVPAMALELPVPVLKGTFPSDAEEVDAPISHITLMFDTKVDLAEVVVITPDQNRIVLHDAFNRGDEANDQMFTLTLPQPVTLPGTYLIEISASVSDPKDHSASSLGTYSSFIIKDGSAVSIR